MSLGYVLSWEKTDFNLFNDNNVIITITYTQEQRLCAYISTRLPDKFINICSRLSLNKSGLSDIIETSPILLTNTPSSALSPHFQVTSCPRANLSAPKIDITLL